MQGGKVDGLVINRVQLDDWRLNYLAEQSVPHVSLERSLKQLDFVGVEVDSFNGFLELIGYLVNQGHSRIAYIGGNPNLKIENDHHSGYQAGLKAANITPEPALVTHADLTPGGGYQATEYLLKLANPPTAIVCVNDLTAIGAMHASHQYGFKVEAVKCAIAGFDGISDSAHTQPPLTTLDQPVYTIARQLVTMLLALINSDTLSERGNRLEFQPKLLVRNQPAGEMDIMFSKHVSCYRNNFMKDNKNIKKNLRTLQLLQRKCFLKFRKILISENSDAGCFHVRRS